MMGYDDMDMIVEILENRSFVAAEVRLALRPARNSPLSIDKLETALKVPFKEPTDGRGVLGNLCLLSREFDERACYFYQVVAKAVLHRPMRKDGWKKLSSATRSDRCLWDQRFRNVSLPTLRSLSSSVLADGHHRSVTACVPIFGF